MVGMVKSAAMQASFSVKGHNKYYVQQIIIAKVGLTIRTMRCDLQVHGRWKGYRTLLYTMNNVLNAVRYF